MFPNGVCLSPIGCRCENARPGWQRFAEAFV
jgi:hypothetical protein